LDEEIKDMSARLKEEKQKKSKTKPVKENIASQLKLVINKLRITLFFSID